jgi:protein-S-isoprenylcysteine O-methyltransferase Ste14
MSNFISRYGLFVVIGAIVVLIAVNGLFSSSPVVIALQVIAVGINIWARRSFPAKTFRIDATPTAQTIIRRGPYTLIRHPMYSSVLLIIWSGVLSHISLLTVVIGLGATIVSVIRIISEERFLRERYPDYAEYVKTTKAVIPYLV